ncbi:hypothetical protein [Paractinoplanes globisporus]|uniref:Uncharacterized protein n=1 Tax=Paractinoplanes globisporus TaxID=113565 RepID=A0ABW6W7M0_9ACTN|nr:hypothetical protein [Actinoplanes globisporus]
MREPHWHPVTAEMGYVACVFSRRDGMLSEYVLNPGDVGYRATATAFSADRRPAQPGRPGRLSTPGDAGPAHQGRPSRAQPTAMRPSVV